MPDLIDQMAIEMAGRLVPHLGTRQYPTAESLWRQAYMLASAGLMVRDRYRKDGAAAFAEANKPPEPVAPPEPVDPTAAVTPAALRSLADQAEKLDSPAIPPAALRALADQLEAATSVKKD